jgi:hypothetical protein
MQKDFERCCQFLAQMMEKYGAEVLAEITVELKFEPELWILDVDGKKSKLVAYAKGFARYQKKVA